MIRDGPSLLFEVFLARLASQLGLFMTFMFLDCILSFSSFCYTIFLLFDLAILLDLPPHLLFYTSNLDLFPQMISYLWGLFRSADQDLSFHLAFLLHHLMGMRKVACSSLVNLTLIFVDSWLTRYCLLEL
jgi:hypothetical protein